MSRRRKKHDDAPGQDSFLDIVANLVGIMIILVMVVGARAKDAWVDSSAGEPTEELVQLEEAVEVSASATTALERNINDVNGKVKVEQAAVAARRKERNEIQLMLTFAEQQISQKRALLNGADRRALELRRDLTAAERHLQNLEQKRHVVQNAGAEPIVLEHIPTPMAKTVFGKEIHFRLLAGHLAHVPLDELIDLMKGEMKDKAEKLRQQSEIVETVGPISGFHLRYQLQEVNRVEQTQFGAVQRKGVEFTGFYLVPMSEKLGEPFQQALRPGSQFRRQIDRLNPDTTTITVWVYPDSFNEFLVLKRELFQRGFLTASWPLPADQPIAGSPNGRRSSAQ